MAQLPEELMVITYDLVPIYNHDGFEEVFDELAGGFTVGEQYQIKNELLRITEPYAKVIDLRGKVSGKCRKFVHKGRIHYLDESAIEVFNTGLSLFGQYTRGIWEDVNNTNNNFWVLQEKKEQERLNTVKAEQNRKAEKLQQILATKLSYTADHYPVHVIRFGDYLNREEERMNYSVQALLHYEDGREMEAVTKDFSIKGLYLRVPLAEKIEAEDIVKVTLQEQDKAYDALAKQGIEYQVKRIEYIDKVIWLGLTRTFAEAQPIPEGEEAFDDDFAVYAKNLIASNKYVYKINLDNAIDAALKQGYEQVFFSRTVTIPLFVETLGSQYRLRYALTTGLNADNYKFWLDEAGQCYLSSLFTSAKIRTLVNDHDDESILYCFTHKIETQILFFAAFDSQLAENPALCQLFCGYGAGKDSWKVFRIKRVAIDKTNTGNPFVIPDRQVYLRKDEDAEADQATDNSQAESIPESIPKSIPEPTVPELGNLTHALLMTEISDDVSQKLFSQQGYDAQLMSEITQFQVHYNDSGLALKRVNFGLDELRHEPRFSYKTKVLVKLPNGMQLDCASVDFSARGLKVTLPRPVAVDKGNIAQCAFPLLQQITKKLVLSELDYRVVGTENNLKTLYLHAISEDDNVHHGVKFFYDLIKRNRRKLTLVADSEEDMLLIKTLKNLYQQSLGSIPYYVTRIDGKPRITQWVKAVNPHPLFDLFKTDNLMTKVDISSLMANKAFDTFINGATATLKAVNQYQTVDLFIRYIAPSEAAGDDESDDKAQSAFVIQSSGELSTIALQQAFVNESLALGQFFCLRVTVSLVAKVDTHKIAEELEYIHHYARHKSKTIAQLLTRINQVGEMVDITGYVQQYLG
ncbi:MAG: hypothetical protein ACI8WB_005145 [Phenylobacterium sp.]|jgi:hypothetical protein